MILILKQNRKGLFEAAHQFLKNEKSVGTLLTTGGMEPTWAEIHIDLFDISFDLTHQGNMLRFSKGSANTGDRMFRPYHIVLDNEPVGEVYQFTESQGLYSRIDYFKMMFKGCEYFAYPIAYGRAGYRTPIYKNGSQIALITKSAEVRNDMHDYGIFALTQDDAKIAGLFCAYMYANGGYKPGVKVRSGIHKEYRKTSNKVLLEKDTPAFEQKC